MAKVTSKFQVTVPKTIADRYSIRPGDEIEWIPAGDVIRVVPSQANTPSDDPATRVLFFDRATELHRRRPGPRKQPSEHRGWTREIFTAVAALFDTNILVYRFDNWFPEKRKIATDILRRGSSKTP